MSKIEPANVLVTTLVVVLFISLITIGPSKLEYWAYSNITTFVFLAGLILVSCMIYWLIYSGGGHALRNWGELSREIGESSIEVRTISALPVHSFIYKGHTVSYYPNRYSCDSLIDAAGAYLPLGQANSFLVDCKCNKEGLVLKNLARFRGNNQLPEELVNKYALTSDAQGKIRHLGRGSLYVGRDHVQYDIGNKVIKDKNAMKEIVSKLVEISDALIE